MAKNNYDVNKVHKYRFITPYVISKLSKLLDKEKDERTILLLFYLLNFVIISATAYVLYLFLLQLGFKQFIALLGITIFLTSRVTIYSTAVPLVDSAYYLAIALVVYLALVGKITLLAFLFPLLILTKENIIPILLMPFANKANYHQKRVYILSAGLFVAVITFFLARFLIDNYQSVAPDGVTNDFLHIIATHFTFVKLHILKLFSLAGIHDVFHSFTFFWFLAFIGYFINKKQKKLSIPLFISLLIPISIFFSILSGNFGRMLFTAFPVVIPYALISIQHVLKNQPLIKRA